MLRRDLLRTWIATPLVGWLRRWPRIASADAPIEVPNAADAYRKAFGWVKGLRPEESAWLRKSETVAIEDRQVETILKQARPALRAIREAAKLDRCDWGTETVTSEMLGKGHFDVCNIAIIRVACLSARRNARAGRARDALDDLFAGLTLAHRIGTGGVLIPRIVECGGEVAAFRTLGRILPGLGRDGLDDLSRRLDALPPPEPASAVIGPESRFILGYLRPKLEAVGPTIEDDEWARIGFDAEEAETLKALTGGDREKLLRHLEATGPAFAELARRLDLPRPGCRAALDEFARTERTTQPIVAGLVEKVWGIRHIVDRMKALRAMLRAGIALVRDGEAAFRAVSDPFGTGPFGLERRGKGYLIRSALDDATKPEVTLSVGEEP